MRLQQSAPFRVTDDIGEELVVLADSSQPLRHAIVLTPDDVDDVVDPKAWSDLLRLRAEALDAWHARGRYGVRPPGRLRTHGREHLATRIRPVLRWVHAHVLDPDGRPDALRERDVL